MLSILKQTYSTQRTALLFFLTVAGISFFTSHGMVIDRPGKGPNLKTIENMRKFMMGKAEGEGHPPPLYLDKLIMEIKIQCTTVITQDFCRKVISPHGQENPAAGVGYRLRIEICEKNGQKYVIFSKK
jgi:hypothetical protein